MSFWLTYSVCFVLIWQYRYFQATSFFKQHCLLSVVLTPLHIFFFSGLSWVGIFLNPLFVPVFSLFIIPAILSGALVSCFSTKLSVIFFTTVNFILDKLMWLLTWITQQVDIWLWVGNHIRIILFYLFGVFLIRYFQFGRLHLSFLMMISILHLGIFYDSFIKITRWPNLDLLHIKRGLDEALLVITKQVPANSRYLAEYRLQYGLAKDIPQLFLHTAPRPKHSAQRTCKDWSAINLTGFNLKKIWPSDTIQNVLQLGCAITLTIHEKKFLILPHWNETIVVNFMQSKHDFPFVLEDVDYIYGIPDFSKDLQLELFNTIEEISGYEQSDLHFQGKRHTWHILRENLPWYMNLDLLH